MSTKTSALPLEYEEELKRLSLGAAWTKLSQLVPMGRPIRHAGAMKWGYEDSRRCLLRAGELVPMELAERRVLGLVNRGLNPPRLATTPSIFVGLQLILPGEYAHAHRHTPAAARLVIEGAGAFTTVNGVKMPMAVNDLILTPPHHWHSHYHDGNRPVVWMDILDHPVAIPLETSFLSGEEDAALTSGREAYKDLFSSYGTAGLVPFRSPLQSPPRYPITHFPWAKTREALVNESRSRLGAEAIHMMFVNPDSGQSLFETLTFSVLMLRPGEELLQPRRSASAVFQVIEGDGESQIDEDLFSWSVHDTLACPTFAEVRHRNRSGKSPAFLLQIDDSVLQHKLGFYSEAASDKAKSSILNIHEKARLS